MSNHSQMAESSLSPRERVKVRGNGTFDYTDTVPSDTAHR
jgi:hypothetical protein